MTHLVSTGGDTAGAHIASVGTPQTNAIDVAGAQWAVPSIRTGFGSRFNRAVKRLLDIVLTIVALVLLLPILVSATVLIVLDGGPILSAAERVGRAGRSFGCLRFRTTAFDHAKPNDGPHMSWIGNFLRVTGIEELPQLINVLRGDMSLVGVRRSLNDGAAEERSEVNWYGSVVRPGLTGLWRVSDCNPSDDAEMARLDNEYVRNWSLWRDISILCLSLLFVFRRAG